MKNTTEISIARALVELKLLDKRIERAIRESLFGTFKVGNRISAGFTNVKDAETRVKADFQSVKDLIRRRSNIKSAIVVSNAESKVVVNEVEMSRAEAIERKTSIEYEMQLLHRMKNTYAKLVNEVDDINEDVKRRLDNHLETIFGKEGKPSTQAIEDISRVFNRDNEAHLIDPIGLKKQIDYLTNDIEGFLAEVDHVLNESNTLTKILIHD